MLALSGRFPRRPDPAGLQIRWRAAPRALRPKPRTRLGHEGRTPGPARDAVALSRAPPDDRRQVRLPRRADHSAQRCGASRRRDQHPPAAHQGRGPPPHRHIQSSRCRRRSDAGDGARCARDRATDGRQRRRRVGRVRCARRDSRCRRHARHDPRRDHPRDVRLWCGRLPRIRLDRRCRRGREAGMRRSRLVRRVHAARAISHRGKEDDGLRARGPAWLAAARRDRLPDRRRSRSHRDVEGFRRAPRHRLARPETPTLRRGTGRRLRADRASVR